MQKKKKVSKTKTQSIKKAASKKAKPKTVAKKAAKKAAVKKTAAPKVAPKAKPAQKAAPKAATAKVKVSAPAMPAYIPKVDVKSLSPEAQEQYKKWLKLQRQLAVEKTMDYRMSDDFDIKTPISHKVHGWGVVMQKRDNYIDVLFELGVKTLIVNYKP